MNDTAAGEMNYKIFSLQKRQKALLDARVQTLMSALPTEIGKKMTRAFHKNDHSGQDASDVLKYFLKISKITQAVVEDKGLIFSIISITKLPTIRSISISLIVMPGIRYIVD